MKKNESISNFYTYIFIFKTIDTYVYTSIILMCVYIKCVYIYTFHKVSA